jgi:beta-barrel assembly-enhancing protease
VRVAQPGVVCLVAASLLVQSVRPALAAKTEREVGRQFLLEVRSQLPVLSDPAPLRLVQRVGGRIVKALGATEFDYQFFVIDHPALNAFAVPGGYVFVFSGLLAKMKSEDELAGVLGHEIAHVNAHHLSRMQQEGQAWNVAALLGLFLGLINPVLGAAAIAAATTAQLKFSRQFEQEADFLGLKYMTQAGFDPHGMPDFFKEILLEQRLNPTGVPAYMLSHPVTDERVTNALTTITTQHLAKAGGKRTASLEVREVQAVTRAVAGPAEVVIEEYRRPVEANPNDAAASFLLGRVYQVVGQLDSARRAFERAATLGGPSAHYVDGPLGVVYSGLHLNAEARIALERALQRRPDDAAGHLELGRVFEATGDDAAALREYQRAVSLAPDMDEAQRMAGLAFGRKGEQGMGFYHLALAARLRGDLPQALSHFRKTDELLPDDSPRRGEVEAAIEELRPLVRQREQEELDRERRRRRFTGLGPSSWSTRQNSRGPAPYAR